MESCPIVKFLRMEGFIKQCIIKSSHLSVIPLKKRDLSWFISQTFNHSKNINKILFE